MLPASGNTASATLIKTGTGSLTFTNTVAFLNTIVNDGTLVLSDPGSGGFLQINSGLAKVNATNSVTFLPVTINVNDGLAFLPETSASRWFLGLSGAGNLALTDTAGAPIALQHAGKHRPREQYGREHIQLHELLRAVCRQRRERHVVREGRVVDQQIEAETRRLVRQLLDPRGIREIEIELPRPRHRTDPNVVALRERAFEALGVGA